MPKNTLLYCATDKEIYDVLMSSKQRITDSVMLELARDRGIFYSPNDSRERFAQSLSLLPHDYNDLNIILEHRENSGRPEKITSIILNTTLSIEDIREVSKEYKEQASPDENIIAHPVGTNNYNLNVHYSEVDYSKTRLVQRRPREANIEFIIEDNRTIVRMPSNPKAKEIVKNLKGRLDKKKETQIPTDAIELTEFSDPEMRTAFFIALISKMDGFQHHNVTSLKVESNIKEPDENELQLEEDQETEEAKQQMLALVKNVALKGQSLLASAEYQQLRAKGFYITSVIWQSRKLGPNDIIECEAGFEEPEAGKGFKYLVRGIYNFQNGEYTKTLRPVPPEVKQQVISLIEQTAHKAIAELRREAEEGAEPENEVRNHP